LLHCKKQYNNLTIQQSNYGFTLIELLVIITFIATNNPPYTTSTSYTTGTGQIGSLDPGKTHWWRLNTHFAGDPQTLWYPLATGVFTTPGC